MPLENGHINAVLQAKLATHLGPNVARMAVKSFAQKELGRKPEELTAADMPQLIAALRPMLVVMIGKDPTQVVLDDLSRTTW